MFGTTVQEMFAPFPMALKDFNNFNVTQIDRRMCKNLLFEKENVHT